MKHRYLLGTLLLLVVFFLIGSPSARLESSGANLSSLSSDNNNSLPAIAELVDSGVVVTETVQIEEAEQSYTLHLPLIAASVPRVSISGVSFVPPASWSESSTIVRAVPVGPVNNLADVDSVRLISPDEEYHLEVVVDWHAMVSESVFGTFRMELDNAFDESLVTLPTGELLQVMRANTALSNGKFLLAHAAFRSDDASYAMRLFGEGLDEETWKLFEEALTSMVPTPDELPASSLAQVEVVAHVAVQESSARLPVSYDRDAAVEYANLWTIDNPLNNDDDCYLWYNSSILLCYYQAGHWGVDAAHFINMALRAGGLDVPTNPEGKLIEPLRTWLLNNGGQEVSVDQIVPGDVIFVGTGSCWGWGGVVADLDSTGPRLHVHSRVNWTVNGPLTDDWAYARHTQMTSNNCGTTNNYSFVHLDTVQDQAGPLVEVSLTRSPSTPGVGEDVQATFRVCNYGGAEFDTDQLLVEVSDPGVDFPSVDPPALAPGDPGGCYDYDQTVAAFPEGGSYVIRAGYMEGGSFHTLGTVAGQVNEQTVYVASGDEIQIQGDMIVDPAVVSQGESVSVQFTARNTGGAPLTDNFRVRIYDSTYPDSGSLVTEFPESGDVTLGPNETYTYNESHVLDTPGIYWVVGEHDFTGTWRPVYGNSQSMVRVMYPMPSAPQLAQGMPPYIELTGEPVNTSSGNFVHEHTDLVIPLPGMPFRVTRYYNHIEADEEVGDFGHGWSWSLGWNIEWREDKSALLTYPDGRQAYLMGELDLDDPFNLAGEYVGLLAETQTLVRAEDGTAVLEGNDQFRYEFNADGRLERVRDGSDNGFDISWNGAQIEEISHTAGATYDFTYTGDYVSAISSPDGYRWDYSYSGAGDLLQATSTVTDTIVYTYDGDHHIMTIEDAMGKQILLNDYDDENRVAEQTDANGIVTTFSYPSDNSTTFVDEEGIAKTYSYDDELRVTQIEDERGAASSFTYDDDYNLIGKVDPMGGVWSWTYDEDGRETSSTNPLGAISTYTYDERGNLIEETNPLGQTKENVYDEHNNLIREIDAAGAETVREYDDRGLVTRETDPTGVIKEYTYNDMGLPVTITDELGGVTTMTYDEYANRTSFSDAEGRSTTSTYDDDSRVLSTTGPMGDVTSFTYDENGNLLTETDAAGYVRTFTYDDKDRLVARTDNLGHVWTFEYDDLGRKVRDENPLGGESSYTYDVVGNLVGKEDERGGVWQFEYDLNNRLTVGTDPLGNETRYGYDAIGQRISIDRPCESCAGGRAVETNSYDLAGQLIGMTDGRGNTTSYDYDAVGRQTAKIDALNNRTEYTYNARGEVVQITDALGNVTEREYNAAGWVVREIDRLGHETVRTYDGVGNLLTVQDARGNVTRYEYDAADRVIRQIDALGNISRKAYDIRGDLVREVDALSRVTVYEYDANRRLVGRTNPRGFSERYFYDALGNQTQMIDALHTITSAVYDTASDLRSTTDGEGGTITYEYDLLGRRSVVTDERGYPTSYSYNADSYLAVVTDPLGHQSRYTYDANGNKVEEIKAIPAGGSPSEGQSSTSTYDALNRVASFTDALGNTTTYQYDALGQQTSITGPRGEVTQFAYDAEGRQTSMTDALGHLTQYVYDEVGNRTSVTDARGFTTHAVYDALNRKVEVIDALSVSVFSEYDAVGNVIAFTDQRDATTHYSYDQNNNLIQTTDALAGVLQTVYNGNDWAIAKRDAEEYWDYTDYDRNGRVKVVTDTLGYVTRYERDASGNVVRELDPLLRRTSYDYDALSRVVALTDKLNQTTVNRYDAASNLIERRDARGNIWRSAYDALNRPISATDPLTGTTRSSYDEVGNVIARIDQAGSTTSYEYDLLNRRVSLTDPLEYTATYTYDEVGNQILQVDKRGTPTCHAYDGLKRRIRTIAGSADCSTNSTEWPTTAYTYDIAGALIAWRDANNHQSTISYDLLGRMVGETNGLGVTWSYQYDKNGSTLAKRDGNGDLIEYTYDGRRQLITTSYPDGRTIDFEYDALGNRTVMYDWNGSWSFTYDALNRPTVSQTPFNQPLSYDYDQVGNRTQMVMPNGDRFDSTYNARNELATFSDAQGDAIAFTYDPRGLMLEQANPNATLVQRDYDLMGQLVGLTNGTQQSSYTYVLDEEGNRTHVAEMRLPFDQNQGAPLRMERTYTYDALNRLIQANTNLPTSASDASTVYEFDLVGNRLSKEGSELTSDSSIPELPVSAQPVSDTYSYNAANQLLADDNTTYEYDNNGNRIREIESITSSVTRIREMTYDYENRLVGMSESTTGVVAFTTDTVTTYTYDGLGRRIGEEITTNSQSETISYLYSGFSLVGTEKEVDGNPITTYYGRPRGGNVLEVIRFTNVRANIVGGRYWTQNDGSGSIIGLTDIDGNLSDVRLYGDNGNLLAGDLTLTTLSYTGQEYDSATGNYHFLYRDYDPSTATWTTQDPYRGDVYDPVSQHRYQYVRNNPATLIDPLGLFDWHTGKVEWGDTWTSVAVGWGTTVDTLKRLNPWIQTPKVGHYLQLPDCRSAQCQLKLGITEVRIGGMSGTECGQRLIQRQKQHLAWVREQRRKAEEQRQKDLEELQRQIKLSEGKQVLTEELLQAFNTVGQYLVELGGNLKKVIEILALSKPSAQISDSEANTNKSENDCIVIHSGGIYQCVSGGSFVGNREFNLREGNISFAGSLAEVEIDFVYGNTDTGYASTSFGFSGPSAGLEVDLLEGNATIGASFAEANIRPLAANVDLGFFGEKNVGVQGGLKFGLEFGITDGGVINFGPFELGIAFNDPVGPDY